MSLISYVTRIHFADRVLEDALPEEARALGLRRPLLLWDAEGEAGEGAERALEALPAGCRPVLAPRRPTPVPAAEARRLARLCREAGCDGVLGLGGAAALDLARLLGAAREDRPALPVIAAPATSATVGLGPLGGAVSGLSAAGPMIPSVILCDPTLGLAVPPERTAAAGMDALTHCLEAYLAASWNPPADGIALDGLRRAAVFLERAVADGRDLEARRELLAAALDAGLAAQKGLGGVHAAARALEAEAGLADRHGLLHAALLPHVLAFNAPALADRLDGPREALRLGPRADLPAALADLGARVGLPRDLGALGLAPAALRRAARAAAEDPASLTNPRHATAADYLRMMEAAQSPASNVES